MSFGIYGLAYWYFHKSIATEKTLRQAEIANLTLNNKILQAEYNYLKSQINPHFLFNTLAFIHNEVERHSAPAGESVALLGELMRYSLRQPELDGMVPLAEEVLQLENYLGLLRLRHGEQLHLHYSKAGQPAQQRLPPHLLITLAENAVKHGVINRAGDPVTISLTIGPGQLEYRVRNRVRENPVLQAANSTGTGLSNLANRLAAAFGADGQLRYGEEDGFFEAGICVNFK